MTKRARRAARTLRAVGQPDLASRLIEAFRLDDSFDVNVLGTADNAEFDDIVEVAVAAVDRFLPAEAFADGDDDGGDAAA